MRLLIREGGTPTVIFGPGRPEVAHAPNEHVHDSLRPGAGGLAAA
jgi:acetylornithine deacetylase/succinyl-diaminopimelate desuccinylase-like protein